MPSFINIFNKRISDTGVKSKWEKVQSGLLFTPVSITPLIDTEDACFGLNASRPIAKGDLKWRDALLVAHRVNSNRLLTFRCLHYTIEGVKFLLRKWGKYREIINC